MTSLVVLTVGGLLLTLTFNLIVGWDVDALCPGTDAFCNGVFWRTVADQLPTWAIIGQALVILSIASPFALARMGR